jgi:hypothetical protein
MEVVEKHDKRTAQPWQASHQDEELGTTGNDVLIVDD